MANGISFDLPISLLIPSPLDVRTVVKDITERDALDPLSLYEGLETYVKSEKKKYKYNGTAWEEVVAGESSKIEDWVASKSYVIGDLVIYNNIIYKCILANNDAAFTDANWQALGSDFKLEEWVTATDYEVDDLVIYDNKIYKCKSVPVDNTTFDETEWDCLSGDKLFTVIDKTIIDIDTDLTTGNYVLTGDIDTITFDKDISNVFIDGDTAIIVTLSGKYITFDKSSGAWVTKSDDKFQTKEDVDTNVHDSLYEKKTIVEHYELCRGAVDPSALTIVEDGLLSDPLTEVELSTVLGKILSEDFHNYVAGDLVVLVPEEVDKELNVYAKREDVYNKTQVDDKITNIIAASGGSVTKTSIVVSGQGADGLGGYKDGDIININTDYDAILTKLLHKVNHPVYKMPTLSIAADKVLVEKNASTSVVLTPTFVQNDAGVVLSYEVFRDAISIDNQTTSTVGTYTDTYTFTGDVVYKYTVNYDEGVTKQDTDGNDDTTGKILAGSISATKKVVAVNPLYIGLVPNGTVLDETAITGLDKIITDKTTVEKVITANFETVVIASDRELTDIINANGFSVINSATKQDIVVGVETYHCYSLNDINVTNFKYTLKF